MVALLISSLLVGMILAIFMRMSLAYRSQQEVSSVQTLLSSARGWLEKDAMQSGYGLAQGFSVASDPAPTKLRPPVQITNSSSGPDEISFYYADPTVQALVTGTSTWGAAQTVDVDSTVGFTTNQLVVLTTASLTDGILGEGKIATYDACVVEIASITTGTPGKLHFATAAPWGNATESHCTTPMPVQTMVYQFVARAYRIDPDLARADLGALQLSRTGDLNSAVSFEDIGMGFTDLQVAGYFYDGDGFDTGDPDSDGQRDWFSSTDMASKTLPVVKGGTGLVPMLQLGISLVARTEREREGLGTTMTPQLTVPTNVTNNMLGDRAEIDLSATSDPHLQGTRLYRHATFYTDLRNIGVGR